ncbi:uroporphyrinogen-III synthase [Pseudomonas sp. WN033]|nr:uroporphyrinogen-III synthase [Pseudomonas sp. WN033]
MTPLVLLTRAEADNQRLAGQLEQRGISSLSVPLLHIEPEPETPEQRSLMLELDRYRAVMVVSPVAARLGLERLDRYWPQVPVGVDWFAVGAATAAELEAYGLRVHIPQDGQDSEALMRLAPWREVLAEPEPRLLIWRGVGGRELLAGEVRAAGGTVDYLELYRRLPAPELPRQLAAATAAGVRGILILSVQALEFWHQAAGAAWTQQRHWRCWVPGARVAERARALGCDDVIVCHGADDAAVVAALAAHPLG